MKILFLFLGPLIFILGLFFPKNKNRMVFGEWFGQTMHDTPFNLFTYGLSIDDDVYFLTKNKCNLSENDRLLYAYSFRGVWVQLTAKVFVCNVNCRDFYPFALSPRNTLVQCGHGPAIKGNFQSRMSRFDKIKNTIRVNTVERYNYALSPHRSQDMNIAKQWGLPEINVIRAPEARCDKLKNDLAELKQLRKALDIRPENKIFLYCPTHRDEGKSIDCIQRAIESIIRALSKNYGSNYTLITKLHPYDRKHAANIKNSKHSIVSTETSATNVMKISDVMISDYSGIVYDFSYLRKPILCYAPDFKDYIQNSRDLLFRLEDVFEEVCYDSEQLLRSTRPENLHLSNLKINMTKGYKIGELSKASYLAIRGVL